MKVTRADIHERIMQELRRQRSCFNQNRPRYWALGWREAVINGDHVRAARMIKAAVTVAKYRSKDTARVERKAA